MEERLLQNLIHLTDSSYQFGLIQMSENEEKIKMLEKQLAEKEIEIQKEKLRKYAEFERQKSSMEERIRQEFQQKTGNTTKIWTRSGWKKKRKIEDGRKGKYLWNILS